MSRALIMACSATKLKQADALPAGERYMGPGWLTLRANRSAAPLFPVWVLSAEHGLIAAAEPIAPYDRRLSWSRIDELVPQVAAELQHPRGVLSADEIFVWGGGLYRSLVREAIEAAELVDGDRRRFTYSKGGIGEQLGQLKAWIRREA